MTQEKCKHCPLATEDRPCPGQRNQGVCGKADPSSPRYRPGFVAKILGFVVAATKHVAAGSPQATQGEAAARLAICRACEHFDTDRGACRQCGCGMELKVSWADQSCPIGRWGSVARSAPG